MAGEIPLAQEKKSMARIRGSMCGHARSKLELSNSSGSILSIDFTCQWMILCRSKH